jgi:YfiH family protein
MFAVSTTREGGVSKEKYASMNLCHYVGDNPEDVMENRRIFCHTLHVDPYRILFPRQTHDDKIINIDPDFLCLPEDSRQKLLYGMDAIVTNVAKVCIGISTADCVPVLLYDKDKQAIGAIHAGWRGTVRQITTQTVNFMANTFGTKPKDLIVAIAPCISKESYEVGDELYDTFDKAGFPVGILFSKNPGTGKFHLDLREANRGLLIKAGIPENNIYISELCTFKNPDIIFSARKSGIYSGRMASCIMLR